MQMQIFSVLYRPYKESISKEMNNDLNLHLRDKNRLASLPYSYSLVRLLIYCLAESELIILSFTSYPMEL